jgi:hypothetical protein
MDPLLEHLEVEPVAGGADHDDLAVEDAARGEVGPDGLDDLGEVAGHRLLVAAADLDLVAVSENDRPEAIPFGFVAQVAGGDVLDRLGEHWLDRRHDGKAHTGIVADTDLAVSDPSTPSPSLRLPLRGARRLRTGGGPGAAGTPRARRPRPATRAREPRPAGASVLVVISSKRAAGLDRPGGTVATGWSRVQLGDHTTVQVIAGGMLGGLIAAGTFIPLR